MKVVMFCHEYPPFQFGGVGVFIKDLASGLANLGIDVTVLCGRPVPWELKGSNLEKSESFKVIRLDYPNITPRHISFQLYNSEKVKKILKNITPDVIHGHGGSSYPSIRYLKDFAPIVETFHGSAVVQRDLCINSLGNGGSIGDFFVYGLGYPVFAFLDKKAYEKADACVAVSRSLKNQLISEWKLETTRKFTCIPNGVDLTFLDKIYNSLPQSDLQNTLVFGGRLFWNKGVLNLVDLAYLLEKKYKSDLKVMIFGSGPMHTKLLDLRNKYNLKNLEIRNAVNRGEFMLELMKSKFVLLPSYYEAAPMLILEGMCLGKIPVMFDLPFSREFTKNGRFGILANNCGEMATKIVETLDSFEKNSKAICHFARKNFNIIETAKAYCELYNGLLG